MSERILKMPRLGETMEEGRITGWLVKPGEFFRRGDSILEIETDKTVAEYPALGDGTLTEILAQIGETVDVGAPIARVDIGDGLDWTGSEEAVAGPAMATTAASPDPAKTDLLMPRLGETMEEGRIVRWLKTTGEVFRRGDPILEIETDKTVAEFPALADGRLIGLVRQEGELVPVGEPIARIVTSTDVTALPPAATRSTEQVEMEPRLKPTLTASTALDRRVRATPLARRLAHSHGLDITAISGSGRRRRVEKADVLAVARKPVQEISTGKVSFAPLQRGQMAYLDSGGGGGEPIMLLHGFAGDHATWGAVESSLRRAGRRVIVPDLPGHGLTEIEADTVADLGADLGDLLDHLGLARVSVIAHSLGAAAGLAFSTRSPDRVSALTLIAPAGLGLEIDTEFVRGMAWVTAPAELSHLLRRLSVQPPELSPAALAKLAEELSKGRLKRLGETIVGRSGQSVDTLSAINGLAGVMSLKVLFGLEDKIIPWQQVTALPPAVAIHLLARSGHMPQWDQVRDVVDIVIGQGGPRG